jgi:hypothetical protein
VRKIQVRRLLQRGAQGVPGRVGTFLGALVVAAILFLPQTPRARALPNADNTPPVVTYSVTGITGSNGWYRGSSGGNYIVVHWSVTDPESQIIDSTGCEPAVRVNGPNTGTRRTCSAASDGGTTTVTTKVLRIDATAPSVRGGADRAPDAGGWYNHALTVTFSGTDATSGVASCSSTRYRGPDSASARVSGGCIDRAGNVGNGSFGFAYDATPPMVKKLTFENGNRTIRLRWAVSSDTKLLEVTRSPGKGHARTTTLYRGAAQAYRDKRLRVGAKYRYTLSAFDQASNRASKTVSVTATGALLKPVPGARVTTAPRLAWTAVKGASYYNVQLVRDGTIFSAWPSHPSLKLPRKWVYKGHHYRLHRGVYKWFVWPGFGKLAANRYGHALGRSSFLFAG